jgi:hypothetical protein
MIGGYVTYGPDKAQQYKYQQEIEDARRRYEMERDYLYRQMENIQRMRLIIDRQLEQLKRDHERLHRADAEQLEMLRGRERQPPEILIPADFLEERGFVEAAQFLRKNAWRYHGEGT